MPPINRGPPHTRIRRARHAPRRAPPSRRDGGAGLSRYTSRTLHLRTPALSRTVYPRGPDVLHMPSCKGIHFFFLIILGSRNKDSRNQYKSERNVQYEMRICGSEEVTLVTRLKSHPSSNKPGCSTTSVSQSAPQHYNSKMCGVPKGHA